MGDIVSESTGDFISVRLGDFVGIRNTGTAHAAAGPALGHFLRNKQGRL
ncbi:hypothetical protein ACVWXM_002058 [Bradyrhizobium sp. GM7.3]